MIKVLFVCLGNICRSPMAEFVFKQMVEERGLSEQFEIDSSSTFFLHCFVSNLTVHDIVLKVIIISSKKG